jgi:hypothetical protein
LMPSWEPAATTSAFWLSPLAVSGNTVLARLDLGYANFACLAFR